MGFYFSIAKKGQQFLMRKSNFSTFKLQFIKLGYVSSFYQIKTYFLTFPACFSIPNFFSNLNYNCSNLLDMRNLQEQVKKAFCYQKLF